MTPPARPKQREPFVALLRGINVGGHNRVPMAELRAALSARGLADVRTYIASGNVIALVPPGRNARQRLTDLVAETVTNEFDVTVAVLVRSGAQIQAIAAALPEEWLTDTGMRVEVLYLFDDIDDPGVLDELPLREGVDQSLYTPGAVLWAIRREEVTRSGLGRIIGGPLYSRMTGRNGRTARALAAMVADSPDGP